MCGRCQRLRLDAAYREQILRYLAAESEAGDAELPLCPECRRCATPTEKPGESRTHRSADRGTGPHDAPDVISFRPILILAEKRNGKARR